MNDNLACRRSFKMLVRNMVIRWLVNAFYSHYAFMKMSDYIVFRGGKNINPTFKLLLILLIERIELFSGDWENHIE